VLANDRANNALFRNLGNGHFAAVTNSPVVTDGGNSFGSQWADIDLDGDLDLFITNAFNGGPWRNFLYLNQNDGTFRRDTAEPVSKDLGWSYGAAFGDSDGDGDLELAVANCLNANQREYLYENHSAGTGRHWIGVRCTGKTSNRSAIGAKVFATALIGGEMRTQLREISTQSGHCGQNQLEAHFGLADAASLTYLAIHWPSGIKDTLRDVAADRYISVLEGAGITGIQSSIPVGIVLQAPVPNPFGDTVSCQFSLERSEWLSAEILDNAGRVIRHWATRHWPAGTHLLHWDGHADSGAVAASGIYHWVIKTDKGNVAQRVVKID
jgi:ASPIC and UnbV/FG-GAP-like repeat/FlgD Ig-like domain